MIPDNDSENDVKSSEGEVQSNKDGLQIIKKYNRLAQRDINSIVKDSHTTPALRRSTRKRRQNEILLYNNAIKRSKNNSFTTTKVDIETALEHAAQISSLEDDIPNEFFEQAFTSKETAAGETS